MTSINVDIKTRIETMVINSMAAIFPEDELKALVDKAIEKFFTPSETFKIHEGKANWQGGSYNKEETHASFGLSPFETLVWSKVFSISKKVVDEYFEKESQNLKAKLEERFAADTGFSGKVSDNIASMATIIQQRQTDYAIGLASMNVMNDVRTIFNRNNISWS